MQPDVFCFKYMDHIVRFVDIGGILDHHCFNSLFTFVQFHIYVHVWNDCHYII